MEKKRIKVLTLGDMPLSTSGVGNQTKYVIETLLRSDKFDVFSLGGAMKHPQYNIIHTEEWGERWKLMPVDQFGTKELVRSLIWREKPDILWFMTDPRFWGWLWEMDNEIRQNIPMVYYHVWDNYPYPKYNKKFYESNDVIVSISKLTNDIVKNVAPDVELHHIPHAVNTDVFCKIDDEIIKKLRKENKGPDGKNLSDRFVVLFNSRNARRKHSGTIIFWFKEFLDKVGHENAVLLMHTEPTDPNGPDLTQIVEDLELNKGQVLFSRDKIDERKIATLYNLADITVNISDAEGFGLSCLESLACETPAVVQKTGGLQEQITDGKNEFGVGIEPSSKQIVGSQLVPYVMEDRLSKEDFLNAITKMYEMDEKGRKNLGALGRKHVEKNYNFDNFNKSWLKLMLSVHKKYGSWKNRKKYKNWRSETL
jgi:glycosyltransferase involved in cell wall biosynthesis